MSDSPSPIPTGRAQQLAQWSRIRESLAHARLCPLLGEPPTGVSLDRRLPIAGHVESLSDQRFELRPADADDLWTLTLDPALPNGTTILAVVVGVLEGWQFAPAVAERELESRLGNGERRYWEATSEDVFWSWSGAEDHVGGTLEIGCMAPTRRLRELVVVEAGWERAAQRRIEALEVTRAGPKPSPSARVIFAPTSDEELGCPLRIVVRPVGSADLPLLSPRQVADLLAGAHQLTCPARATAGGWRLDLRAWRTASKELEPATVTAALQVVEITG